MKKRESWIGNRSVGDEVARRKSLADTLTSQTIDLSRSTLYLSGYLDHMDLSDLFVGSFFFLVSSPTRT